MQEKNKLMFDFLEVFVQITDCAHEKYSEVKWL